MSTCQWCTPSGPDATEFLKSYASQQLSPEDFEGSNDDLCYCLDCVVEYHKAREKLPNLHEVLWDLETSRLVAHMEKSMQEEAAEDDELFIVDENGETQLSGYLGPDFENNLRVPLLEILKYPYLLLHEKVSELCVEVLCRMEQSHSSFQVFEKYPGIYLFLVHPNEVIRRWAILTARNLGKVDRDDYYDLQEVLTCLFKVIELGLFESPDIYSSSMVEKGKLILLPSHLYDTANYKNYWLGICMLLTVLEEQAMDSLLLGPDKQNDFMQTILHTMEKETADDSTDPFWPALHCFMVILDQLGSKVWGQLIDPVQAFQTIINSLSYNNEINNIRSSFKRTKSEPESDYNDGMETCSQIVYNYNTERPQKDAGWRAAICPDYCPNMYEEMQTLANVLQSDIGRDMRVHDSTFLWFIPFVQSLMDLKDLGIAYIGEVIHYLCSEITGILNERIQQCDKVSEFFLLILVSIIELHRNKRCLHLLWISSRKWVEAVVSCAKLPAIAFTRCAEKASGPCVRSSAVSSQASNSVQHACVQLIRSLLRQGYQIGQNSLCKHYLDKLNLFLRGNLSLGWQLNIQETQELHMCLKQVIRNLKDRPLNSPLPTGNNANSTTPPAVSIKQEKGVHGRGEPGSPFADVSKEGGDEGCQENPFTRRQSTWEEECRDASKSSTTQTSIGDLWVNIKKEPGDSTDQEYLFPQNSLATKVRGGVQENRNNDLVAGKCDTDNQCFNPNAQPSDFRTGGELEDKCEAGSITPMPLATPTRLGFSEHVYSSDVKESNMSPSSSSKFKVDAHRLTNLKNKLQKTVWSSKLLLLAKPHDLQNCASATKAEVEQPKFCTDYLCTSKECQKHQGVNTAGKNAIPVDTPSSRSCESTQEKSVNGAFQSRPVPTKETPLECPGSSKSEPGMWANEDNRNLHSGISDTLQKKVSTEEKSSSLLKSVFKQDSNIVTSDQEQPNLNDLVKPDCKGQISKTLCMDKNWANNCVPSTSENKQDVPSLASQTRPLTLKCESSDTLLKFSEYFKRGSNSVVKKEEDFVKVVSEDNTLTDSQIDRDLSKLSLAAYAKSVNFSFDSSQESSVHHNVCDIKRKVKGAVRSSSGQRTKSPCDPDRLDDQIITISDSSDEEKSVTDKEETRKMNANVCPEKQPSASSCVSDSGIKTEPKAPSSPLSLEDCESQYFEFETEDDVFSVWEDTQAMEATQDYSTETTREYKPDSESASADSNSGDLLNDHTNEWGYDMDYISDDTMEEEANLIEKQIENTSHQKEAGNTKRATDSTGQESVSKESAKDQLENFADKGAVAKDFTQGSKLPEPGPSTSKMTLASKLAYKKNSTSPQQNIRKSKVARNIQRSPKKPFVPKAAQSKKLQSTSKNSQPGRSMPAVVPPKKVRPCPAPESTAESCCLKKGPRKAIELSQGSLDRIAKLRSHGKAAGRVGGAQKQKSSAKHNKNMLASREVQFLRQTRPQNSARVKNHAGSSESRNKKVGKGNAESVKQKPQSFEWRYVENQRGKRNEEIVCPSASERKLERLAVQEQTSVSELPGSLDSNRKSEGDSTMVPPVLMDSGLSLPSSTSAAKEEPSGRGSIVQPECEKTISKENGGKPNESSEDDDDGDLFLTQLDPVDMELCSEEESVKDTTVDGKNPEEMDTAESPRQNESSATVKCKYEDCMEKVEKPGEHCSKHSTTSLGADHLFAKPSIPPPSKTRKPSTTKIFSSASSSRNAAFSRDLEDVQKLPPASKSKVNAAKAAVVRPPNVRAVPTGNQTCATPSFSNVPQPRICNNVLQPQNRLNDNASNVSRRPVREACYSYSAARQFDHSVFVNQVLQWTYDMFASCSQFGPPSHLLQSVVAPVPVQFQGYSDYFNTFFPLMMLNAFETLAQEWIENQRVRERSYYFCLQNFCADLNRADFTAHFQESDLAKQLHPKEDDLIFLVVQKRKDTFREESEVENLIMSHVGLVTRFSRASGCLSRQQEHHTACHLSVQTRGNLSPFLNQQVKCVVVGSLVTTHRMFKGLLLLNRSPLAKPIINPSYNDFCPRDLLVASENAALDMNEYNEDQKRAIETAYAMVKQHPGLPKICLIHGPPGTGKSKTIVGLLSRVLKENTRNEKTTQKTNSKMKPNRFLVCAPSNAAVDELMKKIIVAFKEKCQNKQEPLGNCGDIRLVRLGAEKAINSEVRRFSLDKQVEHRMKRRPADCDWDIQKRKAALDQELDRLSRQRARDRCEKRESHMLADEISRLAKERQQLASQIKEVRGHSQKVQADIILEADIICCTLSTSGGGLLESTFARQRLDPFSCVIVDEAGQSCEVETLIPLIHRCNKLVLVGDPRQLPPTVKSVKAQDYGYDQSLMARLHQHLEQQVQNNILRNLPVVQLTVQYRMHPDICLFPSSYVYGRTLKTDKATEENRCSSEWPFQPYLIFDVGDGREERDNDSFSNPQEVKLVMELIRTIKEKRKDLGLRRIGIITPYSAQKKKIQEQLDRVYRNDSPGEVDTVDAFQGREKDCIIVTCVRANSTKGSIGSSQKEA
ncbi:probable helicase senataxin isoform X2 [Patagioenas fasciata]|uniref:probable helicase senataxin isoform X2 n=1 Tax=Patagioenas fasciata TaxID=372321 RepID=UPI003A98FDE9